MSDERPFQFTIRRLMLATIWFGATAAFWIMGSRNPIVVPLEFRETSPPVNVPLVIKCYSAGFVTLGAGVGALIGRTLAAAGIAFVVVALLSFSAFEEPFRLSSSLGASMTAPNPLVPVLSATADRLCAGESANWTFPFFIMGIGMATWFFSSHPRLFVMCLCPPKQRVHAYRQLRRPGSKLAMRVIAVMQFAGGVAIWWSDHQ